jgi:hypothetical protein
MTQKIKTTDVLNKDSVGDVHQETGWERILSKFPFVIENAVATFLVAAALVISIVILFSGKDSPLSDYRTGAWSLISSVVGAALNHLFGSRRNSRR